MPLCTGFWRMQPAPRQGLDMEEERGVQLMPLCTGFWRMQPAPRQGFGYGGGAGSDFLAEA